MFLITAMLLLMVWCCFVRLIYIYIYVCVCVCVCARARAWHNGKACKCSLELSSELWNSNTGPVDSSTYDVSSLENMHIIAKR